MRIGYPTLRAGFVDQLGVIGLNGARGRIEKMKCGKYVMVSHSLITVAWMFSAWPFYWILGRDPTLWSVFVAGWTCFIIGAWYGREQYTEELRYREIGEGSPIEKLPTLVPFLWSKWNLDFIVPVMIAVILGVAFVAHVWKLYGWTGR